jgi:predicted dehydrogenase
MKTYRVGILGCRSRGTAAARAYAAHPRTEVVTLCDLMTERTAALGDELGVSARYADLDQMMAEAKPDIVAIPTGTEFHYPLCMRVLEYGANIDVEKPMCVNLEQADSVLARAREKGARMTVHHQSRVGSAMKAVRRAIDEGRIGRPRYITACCKGYYAGYGLMNIGTHIINNLLGLVGHCCSVVASATSGDRPVTPEDVVVAAGGMGVVVGERITATLEFDHGVTATLLQHRFPKVDTMAYGFEVMGTEGRLFWKQTQAWWLPTPHYVPDGEHDRWQPLPLELPPGFDESRAGHAMEWYHVDDFVRALDEDREPENSGEEGRHVLEVLMGILEASAYGTRINLPQIRRDHPLLRWRREAGLGDPLPGPRDYASWLASEDVRLGRA